jgi:hypothetical protein
MIVAIHQPHFLPWLGYLHRMMQAELFIVLDHVQFERRNYQNRTLFRMDNEARWLTVPVLQRSQKERITEKEVDNRDEGPRGWGRNQYATLRYAYRDAAFFELYAQALQQLLESRWQRLVDIDQASLEFLRQALDIRTPLVRSSELGVEGTKGELILNLCRAAGGTTLLAGMGGSRGYLNIEEFTRHDIRVLWHEFRHPAYPQCGQGPFIAGLSAIDLLFNCGPASRRMLTGELGTHEARVAA